jgi:hypothetical protein
VTTTTLPGGPTTTTIPPLDLPPFKRDALLQMKLELQQALYPCVIASTGIIVFATPGSIAVGPIVGTTMFGVAAPVCVNILKTIQDLKMVYDDPPDPAFDRIAHVAPAARPVLDLPSCTALQGKDRALCKRLGRAVTHWVGAVGHVSDVAAAPATTANRLGAASAAGDAKASKKQTRAANKLANRLDAAVNARARAGMKLAAVLGAAQTTGALSDSQSAQAVDAVLTGLAGQGLAEEDARAVLGEALAPGTVDVVTTLGNR